MKDTETLYQDGTLALLVPGLFDGTITTKELLNHGDTGIGTLAGLDGEVVIVDGQAFQAAADGSVNTVNGDATMPFASVHTFDNQLPKTPLAAMTMPAFTTWLQTTAGLKNAFAGIVMTGIFNRVHVRVAPKQTKPYPPLTTATAAQPEFTRENVQGTVVGYFAPALYAGATVGGFHLHFISDDHQFAGHLLDFTVMTGEVTAQVLPNLMLHLPTDNADFMKADIELSGLNDAINEAEK